MALSSIVVLVSVAPTDPYPQLFATGPLATWMQDRIEGVSVRSFSARPLTRFQRIKADLREMLRFPGAQAEAIGTVKSNSRALKLYSTAVRASTDHGDSTQPVNKALRTLNRRALLFAGLMVTKYEQAFRNPRYNRKKFRVSLEGDHYTIAIPATVANGLAIQMALLAHLSQQDIAGVLFVTSSGYVEQGRLRRWLSSTDTPPFIAGSSATGGPESSQNAETFISGFCHYFSLESMQLVTSATDFDYSIANDEAWTKWFRSHQIDWDDLGIVWNTQQLEAGECPLCADSAKFVVRCTSHGSRERERGFMQALHHTHGTPSE